MTGPRALRWLAAPVLLVALAGAAAPDPEAAGPSAPAVSAEAPKEAEPPPSVTAPAPKKAPRAKPPVKDPCDRLDFDAVPECANRPLIGDAAPPVRAAPKPAKPPPPKDASRAPGERAAPICSPDAPCPKAAARGGVDWSVLDGALSGRPLLVGAGGGVLLLLLGGAAAWGLASLRRQPKPAAGRPRATAPTSFRRDLVLTDEQGRVWRIDGAALTPGVTAGSGATGEGRLEGEGVAARHVEFWVCDGRLMMRKVADAPLFFNDRLLKDATPEVVSTGDRIRLGHTGFTVTID